MKSSPSTTNTRTLEKGIRETQAMLRETGQDAEMKAMAEEELAEP